MGSKAEVIAYHGWGFDSTCWRSWQVKCEQRGLRFRAVDRGYFCSLKTLAPEECQNPKSKIQNPKSQGANSESPPKIILVHSYGLHLCPIAHLQQADLLIICNSFSEFHPEQESLKRRSQAMLKIMLNQLEANPQLVLQNFRSKCYFPQPEETMEITSYNLDLLIHDLKGLSNSFIPLDTLDQIPKVVLQGAQDQIVSSRQGKTLLKLLGNNTQSIEISDAGHALPFTHFQTCWSVLNATHAAYFS